MPIHERVKPFTMPYIMYWNGNNSHHPLGFLPGNTKPNPQFGIRDTPLICRYNTGIWFDFGDG